MLTASLRVLPAVAWEAVSAGGAGWFAWRALRVRRGTPVNRWRCPHPVPHLVECAAMLYMLAITPAAAHATTGPAGGGSMATSATAEGSGRCASRRGSRVLAAPRTETRCTVQDHDGLRPCPHAVASSARRGPPRVNPGRPRVSGTAGGVAYGLWHEMLDGMAGVLASLAVNPNVTVPPGAITLL